MNKRLMSRRAALGSTAMLLIAGCVGTDAGDDGPTYDPEAEFELPVEDLDAELEDRTVVENDIGNPDFEFEFGEEDPEAEIIILLGYELNEDAEEASGMLDDVMQMMDENEMDEPGDEAYWVEEQDNARCFIRDGNLIVQSVGMRQSGFSMLPAKNRAILYAGVALNYWQEEYADE